VAMFAMTLPMTRLAVGSSDDPQLSPLFAAVTLDFPTRRRSRQRLGRRDVYRTRNIARTA